MPVIAIVKIRRFRENSCGAGCRLGAPCSFSAALTSLHIQRKSRSERKRGNLFIKSNKLFKEKILVYEPWEMYLEDPTVLSVTPVHLISWLYLSRSLMYLLQRGQSSVRFPHTSWIQSTRRISKFKNDLAHRRNQVLLPDAQLDRLPAEETRRTRMLRSSGGNFHLYEQLVFHVPLSHCIANMKPAFPYVRKTSNKRERKKIINIYLAGHTKFFNLTSCQDLC